ASPIGAPQVAVFEHQEQAGFLVGDFVLIGALGRRRGRIAIVVVITTSAAPAPREPDAEGYEKRRTDPAESAHHVPRLTKSKKDIGIPAGPEHPDRGRSSTGARDYSHSARISCGTRIARIRAGSSGSRMQNARVSVPSHSSSSPRRTRCRCTKTLSRH